jgi:imidazolonepropionase-like amidohydrolase
MKRARICAPLFILALCSAAFSQKIAVAGDKLYSAGGDHQDGKPGVVLIEDGKIVGIAEGSKIPDGYQRMQAAYVTPGLIDAKTTAGISGEYNIPADQDQDEETDPNTADVRAFDSFNPSERLIEYINTYGITTIQVAPGLANPLAGQAAIFKTRGPSSPLLTAEEMAVKPVSALVFDLGEFPKQVYGKRNKPPETRMMTAEIIRKAMVEAQTYQRKWEDWNKSDKKDSAKQPASDLKLESVSRVLRGELPAIFNAYREDDIATALRLAREFKLKPVISSATEGYLMRDTLKNSGASVLAGPTLQRLDGLETMNATLENAALLADVGIPLALMTGYESYVPKNRVLLFEAGIAAANGLGFERTLRATTIDGARILGIADRVGSLEKGKDADVVLYDGDPFEYTSHVTAVLVNGRITYQVPVGK